MNTQRRNKMREILEKQEKDIMSLQYRGSNDLVMNFGIEKLSKRCD
jgi:hypothetical protein